MIWLRKIGIVIIFTILLNDIGGSVIKRSKGKVKNPVLASFEPLRSAKLKPLGEFLTPEEPVPGILQPIDGKSNLMNHSIFREVDQSKSEKSGAESEILSKFQSIIRKVTSLKLNNAEKTKLLKELYGTVSGTKLDSTKLQSIIRKVMSSKPSSHSNRTSYESHKVHRDRKTVSTDTPSSLLEKLLEKTTNSKKESETLSSIRARLGAKQGTKSSESHEKEEKSSVESRFEELARQLEGKSTESKEKAIKDESHLKFDDYDSIMERLLAAYSSEDSTQEESSEEELSEILKEDMPKSSYDDLSLHECVVEERQYSEEYSSESEEHPTTEKEEDLVSEGTAETSTYAYDQESKGTPEATTYEYDEDSRGTPETTHEEDQDSEGTPETTHEENQESEGTPEPTYEDDHVSGETPEPISTYLYDDEYRKSPEEYEEEDEENSYEYIYDPKRHQKTTSNYGQTTQQTSYTSGEEQFTTLSAPAASGAATTAKPSEESSVSEGEEKPTSSPEEDLGSSSPSSASEKQTVSSVTEASEQPTISEASETPSSEPSNTNNENSVLKMDTPKNFRKKSHKDVPFSKREAGPRIERSVKDLLNLKLEIPNRVLQKRIVEQLLELAKVFLEKNELVLKPSTKELYSSVEKYVKQNDLHKEYTVKQLFSIGKFFTEQLSLKLPVSEVVMSCLAEKYLIREKAKGPAPKTVIHDLVKQFVGEKGPPSSIKEAMSMALAFIKEHKKEILLSDEQLKAIMQEFLKIFKRVDEESSKPSSQQHEQSSGESDNDESSSEERKPYPEYSDSDHSSSEERKPYPDYSDSDHSSSEEQKPYPEYDDSDQSSSEEQKPYPEDSDSADSSSEEAPNPEDYEWILNTTRISKQELASDLYDITIAFTGTSMDEVFTAVETYVSDNQLGEQYSSDEVYELTALLYEQHKSGVELSEKEINNLAEIYLHEKLQDEPKLGQDDIVELVEKQISEFHPESVLAASDLVLKLWDNLKDKISFSQDELKEILITVMSKYIESNEMSQEESTGSSEESYRPLESGESSNKEDRDESSWMSDESEEHEKLQDEPKLGQDDIVELVEKQISELHPGSVLAASDLVLKLWDNLKDKISFSQDELKEILITVMSKYIESKEESTASSEESYRPLESGESSKEDTDESSRLSDESEEPEPEDYEMILNTTRTLKQNVASDLYEITAAFGDESVDELSSVVETYMVENDLQDTYSKEELLDLTMMFHEQHKSGIELSSEEINNVAQLYLHKKSRVEPKLGEVAILDLIQKHIAESHPGSVLVAGDLVLKFWNMYKDKISFPQEELKEILIEVMNDYVEKIEKNENGDLINAVRGQIDRTMVQDLVVGFIQNSGLLQYKEEYDGMFRLLDMLLGKMEVDAELDEDAVLGVIEQFFNIYLPKAEASKLTLISEVITFFDQDMGIKNMTDDHVSRVIQEFNKNKKWLGKRPVGQLLKSIKEYEKRKSSILKLLKSMTENKDQSSQEEEKSASELRLLEKMKKYWPVGYKGVKSEGVLKRLFGGSTGLIQLKTKPSNTLALGPFALVPLGKKESEKKK